MNSKMICSMILAATMVTGVSVASVAHAEGEDGITAAGLEWQAANGNASVPATEWYAASPVQRVQLSHQYDGGTPPALDNHGRG